MNFTSKAPYLLCSIVLTVMLGQCFTLPVIAEKLAKPTPSELDETPELPEAQTASPQIHSTISGDKKQHKGSKKNNADADKSDSNKIDKTVSDKPTQAAAQPVAQPEEIKFKGPIRTTPTITYGTPSWAPRRVATSLPGGIPAKPAAGATGAIPGPIPGEMVVPTVETKKVDLEKRVSEERSTLNVRIVRHYHLPPADTVMVYPWPVKPPKPTPPSNLPTKANELKQMIIATGYSNRIDFRRPHPLYGWRWVHAFTVAHSRSGLGYPHTILTMYPWTSAITPYVIDEIRKVNALEEDRLTAWKKVDDEYTRMHEEMENGAAAKGLSPVEVKMNRHGIGQVELPPGQWWISATRKLPDLKFYWQVPVTVSAGQTVNAELTNVNAIVVQGGW